MVKIENKNKPPVKTFLKRAIAAVVIVIAIWLVAVIGDYATRPIRDGWERDKFVQMDSRLNDLYRTVKAASKGVESWEYEKKCEADRSGPFPTGKYLCSAIISTEKDATTIREINALHNKYYPIFNSSNQLQAKTELDPQYPNDFGKRFVVSSIFRDYTEKDSGVRCRYMLEVSQSVELSDQSTELYGSSITDGIAKIYAALDCSAITRGDWFD